MPHTTLKELREHEACICGYNKLACYVAGQPFDECRDTYVRIRHDEPICLATVLESNGLNDALWALRACQQTTEMVRAERLFAVWCARQGQHLMTDPRSIAALDVAERHADGLAADAELYVANAAANAAVGTVAESWAAASSVVSSAADAAANAAAWASSRDYSRAAQKAKFIEVFCGDSINVDCLRTKEAA